MATENKTQKITASFLVMKHIALALIATLMLAACHRYGRSDKPRGEAATSARLAPAATAFQEGRIDDAVAALSKIPEKERHQPAVQAFVKTNEPLVLDELTRRASQKAWGTAFVLATRAAPMFPTVAAKVPEYGNGWAEVLRPAISDADANGRVATAIVLRAALAAATSDAQSAAQARQAWTELRQQHRIALEVHGKGDLARVQASLAANDRFELSKASGPHGKVTVTLGEPTDQKSVQKGQASARVQRGTRAVANPARAQLEAIAADFEDRITNLREQRADEQRSPSRSQGSIETFDYQIDVEQQNLAEARANISAAPATIEEADFVDVPYDLETHTLTVSRDVSIEVAAPWRGDLPEQRGAVTASRSDRANAANPAAGLARDPVDLPTAAALMPDLDQATTSWLGAALGKVAMQYYRRVLVDNPKGDGLALVLVLAPEGTPGNHVSSFEKQLGVPMADRFVHALAKERMAVAFDEPANNTTKPAVTKIAEVKPAAPIAPVAPASPKPATPEDPLRAKAGYALTLAPFEMRRGARVVLSVDRDGKLWAGKTELGVMRSNGVFEDPRGRVMLAIDKAGDVWLPKQTDKAGRLTNTTLEFVAGATLAFDKSSHFTMTSGRDVRVSEAVLAPDTAGTRQLALVVAWLGVGTLGMRVPK